MKIKQLLCTMALLSPFTANADSLSLTVGGGFWNEDPSGNIQKITDPAEVDVVDNLFWEEESQTYVFATLEHFVPILPNIRISHTSIDHAGNGTTTFSFDGQVFTGDVDNDISITTTDFLAYYEVLDNVVSLDLGLNIRNLKVDYVINSAGSTTSDSVSETIPMVYAMIGASPWPDLTISGEISYITFEGSTVSDFIAKVSYTTNFLIGVEAGYRTQTFELDDTSDTDADLSFDGIFAGAYLKF